MKITTWNVNSINARIDHVRRYIADENPDILLLQELKTPEFPASEFEALGYQLMAAGQKSYNGVAILSKHAIAPILETLPGDQTDEQARYLEADIEGLRIINIYLPNGNPVDTEKFTYKLAWMKRLSDRIAELRDNKIPFVIGGDFNVIPEDKDCFDPKVWVNDALFRIETRRAFRTLINLGLTDALRVHNAAPKTYTFWDYQAGAWHQNNGIRIDHFLLSPETADLLQRCAVNKTPRGWEKPSDHTPVELILKSSAGIT